MRQVVHQGKAVSPLAMDQNLEERLSNPDTIILELFSNEEELFCYENMVKKQLTTTMRLQLKK